MVVAFAFGRVGEYFVGLVDLFEFLFGGFVLGVQIGMMLPRQLTIGLSYLIVGSIALNAKHFVVVSELYRHQLSVKIPPLVLLKSALLPA